MKNLLGSFFLASFMLFSFSALRGVEIECEDQKCPVLRKKPTQERSPWIEVSLVEEVNQHSQLGISYFQEKKYKEAFNHLIVAAKLKNVGSRYNLGILYEFGLGVEESLEEAAMWYSACGLDFPIAREALDRVIGKKQRSLEDSKSSFLSWIVWQP